MRSGQRQSFYSRSNGLLNFRSNGLQVVALMSVYFAPLPYQFAQMSFAVVVTEIT
jgi:hypothetical protein